MDRAQAATLRRKDRSLAKGDTPSSHSARTSIYSAGGRSIATQTATSARVHFDGEVLLAHVRKASGFTPVRITGTMENVVMPSGGELALAVNGRIAALSGSFQVNGTQRFGALVRESSLREGYKMWRCT